MADSDCDYFNGPMGEPEGREPSRTDITSELGV